MLAIRAEAAQPASQVRHIGFLAYGNAWDTSHFWSPLFGLGWTANQTLLIDQRFAGGRRELLQPLAKELVQAKVDLIVALGTVAAIAAKQVTSTLPIIVHRAADPVGTGLVISLARPGRNITGTSTIAPELDNKRIELLREVLPRLGRIGELIYPANPVFVMDRKRKNAIYRSLGLQPIFVEAALDGELERAITEVARQGGQALLVPTEPFFTENFGKIVKVAQQLSLPIISGDTEGVGAGALLGFGPSEEEFLVNLASVVNDVLRGANPAEVPVRQPTK